MRGLTQALLGLLFLGCGPVIWADEAANDAEDMARWTRKYDHHFQKYSKRYFGPNFDWTWFKAQAIAESRLNPAAKSRAGAQGLMQIMPATFDEIRQSNPHFGDISSSKWNVAAGIYYDRYLYGRWDRYHETTRLLLTFASYNAGFAGIRSALRQVQKPIQGWHHIEPHAPAQTRHYVQRIQRLKQREVALQQQTQGSRKLLAEAAR